MRVTLKSLNDGISSYFAMCDERNVKNIMKPYTVSGLCLHLGMPRSRLLELAKNKTYEKAVITALLRIEAATEELVLVGKLASNPSLGSLKYNFGWSDKPPKPDTCGEMRVTMEDELSKWGA